MPGLGRRSFFCREGKFHPRLGQLQELLGPPVPLPHRLLHAPLDLLPSQASPPSPGASLPPDVSWPAGPASWTPAPPSAPGHPPPGPGGTAGKEFWEASTSRFSGWKTLGRGRDSGREDSWRQESLKIARLDGLGKGRLLALGILEDGEVGRPREGKIPGVGNLGQPRSGKVPGSPRAG